MYILTCLKVLYIQFQLAESLEQLRLLTLPSRPTPSTLHPSLPPISMGSKEQVAAGKEAYNPARGYFWSIEILIVESLQSIESNAGLSEAVTRNLLSTPN